MQQQYQEFDPKEAELIWLDTAITHLCGMNPKRIAMIRRLSRRYDELRTELDIEYPDTNDEIARLIGQVCAGHRDIDDAEEEFIRQYCQRQAF